MTVSTLLDAVMDLGMAVESLSNKRSLFNTEGGWRVLQAAVRQVSVPLRNICIDSEGALLKKTIDGPTFHPLGGRKGRYRRATMSWRSKRRELVIEDVAGKKQAVVVPETKHEIAFGRLYGVDFLDDRWCVIHSPFDLTTRPIPMDAWLDAKALQVNSVSYTVRDALKIVADYEGAHTNELPALLAVGVNPEDVDKGRNMKYRLVNSVYFGCLSYVHIVVLYAALYLTGRFQELFSESGNPPLGLDAPPVEGLIRHIRSDLVFRARIVDATHELIMVGRSDVLGTRRRRPVYRLWSGSPEWDAPAPVSHPNPADQP